MDRVIEFAGNHLYLVSALAVLLVAFIITELQRGTTSITAQELTRLVNQENALVIDIRNALEYREGHITGSSNVPYSTVAEKAAELAKLAQPLIVVCALGQTAGAAAKTLQQAGATKVYQLGGGISSWRQQALPLVR